ncbi:MAG: hypothetical protein ACOC1U_05165 [Spirochaetota bacterium]
MKTRHRLRSVPALLMLICLFPSGAWTQESPSTGRVPASSVEPLELVARVMPYIAVNTLPGFGLGSYLQGDWQSGLVLTAADLLALGLAVPATIYFNENPDDEDGGGYALALLAGYGVYAASRVGGVVYPIIDVARRGLDTESLVAPIFYNTLPGFGLGSQLQGDRFGATIVAGFDFTAFVSLGVLSAAALGREQEIATGAGITLLAAYGLARVAGIVMPIVHASGIGTR